MDEEFQALLNKLKDDPSMVMDKEVFPDEKLEELQKKLNPYSYITEDHSATNEHKKCAAISYTNLREEYLKKLITTSLIGYVYRALKEWKGETEHRKWSTKKAKKDSKKRQELEPMDADEVLQRAKQIEEAALLAKEAQEEAEEALRKSREIVKRASGPGNSVPELSEEEAKLLNDANFALAKSRGMQYAAVHTLRRFGLEADQRIDSTLTQVKKHPEVAEVLEQHPLVRPPELGGSIEMPIGNARGIIYDFLNELFEFNPDAHVRRAYDEVVTDSAEAGDKGDPKRPTLEQIKYKVRVEEEDREIYEDLTRNKEAYNSSMYMLRNEQASANLVKALENREKFIRYMQPISADSDARPAIEKLPPQDTFRRFSYYMEVNYEELRSATAALYNEKPDLDFMLIIYDTFEGTDMEIAEKFTQFKDMHQDEFICDVKQVMQGKWIILGDFKENRENIDFYNKNTDVLKRILDRHEDDKKMGKELMKKRVVKEKARNIRQDGPDAQGLGEYMNAMEVGATTGTEKAISREEMNRLERARGNLTSAREYEYLETQRKTIEKLTSYSKSRELFYEEERELSEAQRAYELAKEQVEVPDNAIQVDIWEHDAGKGEVKKSKFYTEAEAPTHIEEYQRNRGRIDNGSSSSGK